MSASGAPKVGFVRLSERARLPQYMTAGAAGMDVSAVLDAPVVLAPGQRVAVPTGLAMELPEGFEAQVRPRSGLAWKAGITVVNAPGTIDSDYRGEVRILLVNLGQEPHTIEHGERIAQLVISPVVQAQVHEVAALSESARGAGGFGHTGRGS